ncbi:hypothetical protein N5E02_05070 [Stenotrophomonas sp. GD03777]|uniref:hypothetical protein n=1 Tax=Stenotrophomonas sp. GD03777 TaxID=2975380 RepID=UPI00244B94D3|nr:hypothetical protein [Stenotrophomonas sp. GD03777]MDH1660785.1 hypothetical protein [Stenotrophomonas sp. GD03777]
MNAELSINTTAAGRFQIEAFRVDSEGVEIPGSRRIAAEWFPNLITNAGLDRMGSVGDYMSSCMVGSGNAAPAETDTALQARVASTSNINVQSNNSNVSPRYGWRRRTFRFAAGAAAGNLSEVGVGWTSTAVFSRALILDGSGNPTTITVLSDEVLDVTYELRFYISEADVNFNVDISGTTYACVARPANLGEDISTQIGTIEICVNTQDRANGVRAFETQVLGAVTGQPAGPDASPLAFSNSTYVNGTRYKETVVTAGLNSGNFSTGLGSIRVDNSFCDWQINFTPKIPKDATKVLTLNVRSAWSRHVP